MQLQVPGFVKEAAAAVLAEEMAVVKKAVGLAEEATMLDLRRQAETLGWTQLTDPLGQSRFNRAELGLIVEHCRAAALKNPLIIRGLSIRQQYVFGQGVRIEASAEADQKAIDDFLGHPQNRAQLTGQEGLLYAQLELDATGNLFLALIGETASGAPLAVPQVRSIPFEQIQGMIENPDDAEDVWYFKRVRMVQTFDPSRADGLANAQQVIEWHPSLELWRQTRSQRGLRVPAIGGKPVRWDAPIAHRKRGGYNDWQWGLPIVYAALDWAKAHTRYLSNWDNFVDALARVAVTMTRKGATQDQLAAMQKAQQTTLLSGQTETNPAPVSGSLMVMSDKLKLEAFKAAGMAPDVGDAKGFRLQVAASLGVPDHLLSGDVDQGNLATARTLDRPTELAIASEQKGWKALLEDVCRWALEIRSRQIVQSADRKIMVSFPSILEHNPEATVNALAKAISAPISGDLRGAEEQIRKALLAAAGVDDVDALVRDAEFDPDAAQPEPEDDGPPSRGRRSEQQAGEAAFARLVKRTLVEIQKRKAA